MSNHSHYSPYSPGHEALQIAAHHMGNRFVKSKGHNIPSHEFLHAISRLNSKGKVLLKPTGLHTVMHGKIVKHHKTVKETAEHRREEDLKMLQRFFTKTGALQSRDIQKLKDILGRQLVKPDEVRMHGKTLLQKFTSSDDPLSVQAMKILLQYGSDPSRALGQAVTNKFPEKLELLIASGADFGWNDISQMISHKKDSIVKLVLSKKKFGPNELGELVIEAAKSDSLPIIKLLVEYGAPLNIEGGYRYPATALTVAYARHQKEIVQYLLDRGASFGSKGKDPYYVAKVYEFAGRRKPLWTYITSRPR